MKNVLILKFPYRSSFGGGEKHTLLITQELKKCGFDFFLLSSCPTLIKEFSLRNWPVKKIWMLPEPVAKWSLLVFPLLALPMHFVLVYFLIYYRLAKKVKTLYCLSLTEKILITLPARTLGLKVVWVEHVGFQRWLTLNPLKIFYKLWSKLATVIVISQALKQQLIDLGIADKNIRVIYNGFDFSQYDTYRPDIISREKRNFITGTVCRLEKEKGVEYLLLAFKKVLEIIPGLRLVIVGSGSERKKLEWLAQKIGIDRLTQFVGFQGDPLKWIRTFDIFVLPSVGRESFGQVLVDALALERPIIASAIEGTPEVVIDGQTGLLVKPGSSDELSRAIIRLYQKPELARQLALNGRGYVEQNFTLERMLNDYYQTLK